MSAALLAAIALAGCGGSGHGTTQTTQSAPSASAPTTTSPATTGATTTGATTTGATTTGSTTTGTTTTGTTTTPTSTPTSPAPGQTGTTTSAAAGSGGSGPRVPAIFKITAGDQASPSMVSAPSGTNIALTIVSNDGKPHTALVRTAPAHTLQIPAHGRASMLLTQLKDGRYVIVLDHGAGLVSLTIGAPPGP